MKGKTMNRFSLKYSCDLAGAGLAACLVAAVGLLSSAAAEPPAPAAVPESHSGSPAAEHMARQVQAHLDKLASRLEIKSSQEDAWQKFSLAWRDTVLDHAPDRRPETAGSADLDAAGRARQAAQRAADHAQHLAVLAQAVEALQQSLSPQQKLVFNEVARRFAAEHERGDYRGEADHHGEGEGNPAPYPHSDMHGPSER